MSDGSAISFTVSFEAGASGKGKGPKSFTLRSETDVVRIGRAPGNDVVVDHRGASQYHAELRFIPDASGVPQLHVRDLSMNGTGLKTEDDKSAKQTTKLSNEPVPDGSTLLVPMLLKAALSNHERAWLKVDYQDTPAPLQEQEATPVPKAPPKPAAREGSASEQDEEKDAEKNRMQFVELLLKTREVSAGTTYEDARKLLSSNPVWDTVDETTRRECFEIFVEHLGNHNGKKSKKKEKGKSKKEKRRHHEEEAAPQKEAPAEAVRSKKRKDGEKKGDSPSADRHRKSKREKKGRERSRGRSAGGNCSRSPSRQKKRRRGRSGSA